jgi:hypothetical protein
MNDQELDTLLQEEQVVEEQQPEETQESQAAQQAQTRANDTAKNMAALREKAQRAERERDEMMRKLQEIQAKPEADDLPHHDPNDLVEARYVDKRIKKLEDQITKYQQQAFESSIETRIKSQYQDFDAVVNQENMEALRAQYPELAETIKSSSDLHSKAVSAYTLIKKLGIAPDAESVANRQIIEKNMAKPRNLASVSPQKGESPLTRANAFASGLTEDLQKQLRKEMSDAMKNR